MYKRELLSYLARHAGPWSNRQIAAAFETTESDAGAMLLRAHRQGLVERELDETTGLIVNRISERGRQRLDFWSRQDAVPATVVGQPAPAAPSIAMEPQAQSTAHPDTEDPAACLRDAERLFLELLGNGRSWLTTDLGRRTSLGFDQVRVCMRHLQTRGWVTYGAPAGASLTFQITPIGFMRLAELRLLAR